MSRFDCYDDDYDPLAAGRWEANVKRSIEGRRGQAALRDLRAALLALPEKRLIADDFATPDGEVCAVGCAVAYKRAQAKGVTIPEAAKELAAEDSWDGYTRNLETGRYERTVEHQRWDDEAKALVGTGRFYVEERWPSDYTAGKGEKEAGMAYTLAWHIGWMNDEQWGRLTPEKRWEKCLSWVESKLDGATA